MSERLSKRLAALKDEGRAGFVPFIMAGDPLIEATAKILAELPQHGADIIELGMPFSDPTADGPTIQAAGLRALKAGFKLNDLFTLVEDFRKTDQDTPIILMGYANPVFHYGIDAFMQRASKAGADALILVDIPAEERAPYQTAASANQLDIIPLIAPTSLKNRLAINTDGASGFLYYIAIKGITGTASADYTQLETELATIRNASDLPIAVGFGIQSPEDVATVSAMADLVVVGSAIVKQVEQANDPVKAVLDITQSLSAGIQKRS